MKVKKVQLEDIGKDMSIEVSAIESIEPSVDESHVTNPVEQAENDTSSESSIRQSRSFLALDESILRPKKTKQQIYQEISFETEEHNVYSPDHSSCDS